LLRKIISIRNVGRFRSSASTPNPQLAKHTLIFGANGSGKTTLCAILRALQADEPFHIIGRKTLGAAVEPAVEILLENANAVFQNGAWTKPVPEIAIFDGTFVAENVFSGDVVDVDHRRGLYRIIIGREGVALAVEEESLAERSRGKAAEIRDAEAAITRLIPAGVTIDSFLEFPADPSIDAKIAEQQRVVEAAREADQIKIRRGLREILVPEPPMGLGAVLVKTLEGIAADAEAQIAAHILAHGMGERGQAWLSEGMKYSADGTCPFCSRPLQGLALIGAFRAVFSEAYAGLKAEVAALRVEIDGAFGDRVAGAIETQIEQNRGGVDFWGRYCALDTAALTVPADVANAMRTLHRAAITLLDRKAAAPLEPIAADRALMEAASVYEALRTAVQGYNVAVNDANVTIEARRAVAAAGNLKAAEADLARLRGIKTRHEPAAIVACDRYIALNKEKQQIEDAKKEVRIKLDAHTKEVIEPYQAAINGYLERFNAGFRIGQTRHVYAGGQVSSTYQIVINKTAVELGDAKTPVDKPRFGNTLSAGERSTLALVFFLAHLHRDPQLASRIVVFDDPFTSQDAFRRQWTVHEIKCVGAACAQVIVLSHDAGFLRQVWAKCPSDKRVALQLADQGEHGTKIVAFDLDDACQGRAASEMDDLIAYQASGAGKPRDMIKKIRIVLETYCRATYPIHFTGDDNLGDIVGKIRAGGEAHPAWPLHDSLEVIDDYSAQHHHGEDPADAAAPDQIDVGELKGFITLALKIANNLQA
jgi:wobble nucleotide-excising tRNase